MTRTEVHILTRPPARRALRSFMALAAAGFVLAGGAGLMLSGGAAAGAALSGAVFLAVAGLAARAMARGYPHDRLGGCNAVTLLRGAMAAALAAPLVSPALLAGDPARSWAVAGFAALALTLDGADGWLARRSGLVSDFGARFDMEVDALLALILAGLVLAGGKAGPWVLALGGMRYAFVAASLALPWLSAPLPQRFRRKLVCVVQIAALVVLLAPVVGPPLSTLVALAATGLLAWSFAADILWLARRR